MNIVNHPFFSGGALLIARLMVGLMFLLAGVSKFQDIAGTAAYIDSVGLPSAIALAWVAAIFETALGLMIITGCYFKQAALALAVFTVFISFPFHGPSMWAENPMQQIMFMKNMAIAAGLLYMVAFGVGNSWSLKIGKAPTENAGMM